jgi:hypothetical protein
MIDEVKQLNERIDYLDDKTVENFAALEDRIILALRQFDERITRLENNPQHLAELIEDK